MATSKPKSPAPEISLFDRLAGLTEKTHRVGISLISSDQVEYDTEEQKASNLPEVIEKSGIIYFEVVPISLSLQEEVLAILSSENPPPLYIEVPDKHIGTIKKQDGYDHKHPDYLNKLEKLQRKVQLYVCLSCCAELRDSTPGDTIDEKMSAAKEKFPSMVIEGLYQAINNLIAFTRDADFFLKMPGLKNSRS